MSKKNKILDPDKTVTEMARAYLKVIKEHYKKLAKKKLAKKKR